MIQLNIASLLRTRFRDTAEKSLDEKLEELKSRITLTAQDNDILVTPEYTYWNRLGLRDPTLTYSQGKLEVEPPLTEHVAFLASLAEETKTHIFLGTFQERIDTGEGHIFSNTLLYLSPDGELKPIRKFRGSNCLADKHSPYLDQNAEERVITLENGVRVLPIICSEMNETSRFYGANADVVVYTCEVGMDQTNFTPVGAVLNMGSSEPANILNWRKRKLATSIAGLSDRTQKGYNRLKKKLEGVLKQDGAIVVCEDYEVSNVAIIHPFQEYRKVLNYRITLEFVSGTVELSPQ